MSLVILDLVSNSFEEIRKYKTMLNDNEVLALTPYSIYYLENENILFKTFHDLLSTEQFTKIAFYLYEDTLKKNSKNKYFKGYFIDIAQVICQLLVVNSIIDYIKESNFETFVYITDKNTTKKINFNSLTNNQTLLANFIKFDKSIKIKRKYTENKINLFDKLKKYTLSQLFNKVINKVTNNDLKYDWAELNIEAKKIEVATNDEKIEFNINTSKMKYIENIKLTYFMTKSNSKISNLLTFMENNIFNKVVNLQNVDLYFFQHGSYLYKNIFIKYSEIEHAKINFVFNDYTKKLFEDLGAKEVYSVGSILFNKPIKERKKEYEFLYITQCHGYTGNLQYVDFPNSMHSFDGYELYQRHKNIIHLLGTKFRDKKIMIRVHPAVVTIGVYVPFWELAEPYPNITIDVSVPIHTLIEKSKYIISDYFTTEFINRELHYKRDIILFQGAPTPLPEDTIEDMKKMFILVDTVDELEEKVNNIEDITKDRPKYDDIIEYYSSKKCDTKKVVIDILEKEFNER